MKTKSSRLETKISFGHKHVWTDTSGHAHRVSFDRKADAKPKTTAIALTLATLLGAAIGAALVVTAPKNQTDFGRYATIDSAPSFEFESSIPSEGQTPGTAIAPGWGDEFFLADATGVSLFNAQGAKLDFWPTDKDTAPTALAFIADEQSPLNGLLVVAYYNEIQTLRFAAASVEPDEADGESVEQTAPARSAKGAALGTFETALSLPDANVRGVAASSERLFVADFKARRVWRFSWKNLENIRNVESKVATPDCELGSPDDSMNFPGLAPAFESNFCVVYLPELKETFVANSGLFRVDAFNASTGAWVPEHSWAQTGDRPEAFSGNANPIALAVSSEGWVVVAESCAALESNGAFRSPFQLFSLSGSPLRRFPVDEVFANAPDELRVVSIAASSDSRRLYSLDSAGGVSIWTRR